MTSDEKIVQATGIQARYDYNYKMLQKAIEKNDEAKIEVLHRKVADLKSEAASKDIEIKLGANDPDYIEEGARTLAPDTDSDTNADGVSEGTVQVPAKKPQPSGKAKIQAKLAATNSKGKAPDTEAAAAMQALDKGKAKVEGKETPKAPKPRKTHDCVCGCGIETLSVFAPGHDARVKGLLLKVERGELSRDAVPESLAPFVKFKGKHGTEGFRLTAAPVRFPGRQSTGTDNYVENTALQVLEALDV